jgi:hypothetical protein
LVVGGELREGPGAREVDEDLEIPSGFPGVIRALSKAIAPLPGKAALAGWLPANATRLAATIVAASARIRGIPPFTVINVALDFFVSLPISGPGNVFGPGPEVSSRRSPHRKQSPRCPKYAL